MKKRKGYEVAAYKNKPIRLLREGGRDGIWICLYDLCHILKRPIMMETLEAINLCPSSTKIIFKKGDKALYAIHPSDVSKLVCLLRKESKHMEKLCDELVKWSTSLDGNGKNMFTVDQQPPVTFNYMDKFPITFKTGNGKTFVNATEMAKSFGKSPAEWLRLAATTEFRQSLVSSGKSESLDSQIITMRGSNGATWIEETLALEYARWLSAEFSEWCNKKVHELIIHGYTTIDSPVEDMATDISDGETQGEHSNFPIPKTYGEALKLAAFQQEQIEELKGTMEENQFKVDFYEQFIENRDWFKSSTLADELQVTTRALHQFLLEEKICKYENKQWVVHGYHSSLQCDVPYYWTNKRGKTYSFGKVKRWTPAGREYILELWRTRHSDAIEN